MKQGKHLCWIIGVVVGVLGAGSGNAYATGTPAIGYSTYLGGSGTFDGYSLGWDFTLNTNVYITGLGYYDNSSDGNAFSHEVGIFSLSNSNLLVSATVAAGTGESLQGDGLHSSYRYHATSHLLLAGTYRIAAVGRPFPDVVGSVPSGLYTAPEVSLGNSYYIFTGGTAVTFPTTFADGPSNPYLSPNFTFTVVPEPATVAFLAVGGLMLLWRRR